MQTNDQSIKTSLRIPRPLHAELERASDASGITLNAEMIVRLQHDPRDNYAKAILDQVKVRDGEIADGLRKQIAALWGALDRASSTLENVAAAMTQVPPDGNAAALKREVEFSLELIRALGAHR
jgi:hypothetical protein